MLLADQYDVALKDLGPLHQPSHLLRSNLTLRRIRRLHVRAIEALEATAIKSGIAWPPGG